MMQSQTSRPHLSLKEKQHQEREALILQVAEEVLLEKGYHETSMDEIAARVGVAKGTIYRHFPSKEDLVVAIFVRDHQQFSQAVEATLASETTVRAKLEAFLRFMYSGFFSKRTQLLYNIQHTIDLRRLFAEKGNYMRELWEGVAARITAVLEEGKASGELDTSIPTNVMVSAFFGLLSPRSYERLIVGDGMAPAELAAYLVRIYFSGVGINHNE
ncbi:MAG TPA: TetR/AcrR family transcriptional regulator [Ktedonobacteraceae bacterium]|nr:TetR/AcrR family transcriptional regulator [Ktedonobacteraceae bacterium]